MKKLGSGLRVTLIVLLFSSIFMGIQFFPAVNAEGENWLTGWSFRQNLTVNDGIHVITVHYNSGTNVLGHIYLNGKCQPDFDDIRFTGSNGASLIADVTVRDKVNGNYIEYKVDVANSPIYMYYGNLEVSGFYSEEVFYRGTLGDTDELTESYVVDWGGQISGIARESPVTAFVTSLEAVISSDVGSSAQMALLLMNDCLDGTATNIYGRRIVAVTETKNIPISDKHREIFEFNTPVPIYKGTVYGIALWAGDGTTIWYETDGGEGAFFVNQDFSGNIVLDTSTLRSFALGRFMNYENVDEDEQNILFRDNVDYTRSISMWHQSYQGNGIITATAGQGIEGSYAFRSTLTPPENKAWAELAFKGEITNGNKRFWSSIVRLSTLPTLGSHVELLAFLHYDPWTSLNGFGVDRTATGVQWRLSAKSGAGVWSHTLFGNAEANTDYLIVLSYETDGVNAESEVWVTKLSDPELLLEESPTARLTVRAGVFGDLFFIGAADYPLNNVSPVSAFFDEIKLTESYPSTFGPYEPEETSSGTLNGYDFGTSGSPVESGYTQVTESTLYSVTKGYGWTSISWLASYDRGAPDNLRRDLVQSALVNTFNVDLENGDYQITVVIGDNNYIINNLYVYAESNLKINGLTSAAGTFQEVTFSVKVSDGQLNLKIGDNDKRGGNWVLNAVIIEPDFKDVNQNPVADAGGPYSGTVGSPVSFDGSGSIDTDGTIISYLWNFGDGQTSTGQNPIHTYIQGRTYTVKLTVTDDDGATDQDTTTVDFNNGYTLKINVVGNGDVTLAPEQATYAPGTEVTLAAIADPGWKFDGWSGELSGTSSPRTITMDGDKTLTATFSLISVTYTISASAGVGGQISPSGAVTVADGANQLFIITADSGSMLTNVLVDGVSVGPVSEYIFSAVDRDHTISASFILTSTHSRTR